MPKYGREVATIATDPNDLANAPQDCFYVVLSFVEEVSQSPCSLVKIMYENESDKWVKKPGMTSIPMTEVRLPEILSGCFVLQRDLLLLVTNVKFMFFDKNLQVLNNIKVEDVCGFGQTLTTCSSALRG